MLQVRHHDFLEEAIDNLVQIRDCTHGHSVLDVCTSIHYYQEPLVPIKVFNIHLTTVHV